MDKRIFLLAGPNGAGKTTTAKSLNTDLLKFNEFINADEIAKGLAPLRPESVSLQASKLMIKRLQVLLEGSQSFAFETTLAGSNYVKYLHLAHKKGYEIHLMFLWLSSPELAIKRVAQRVTIGGHFIPEEIVRRRFFLGLRNLFKYYLPLADNVAIVDNSDAGNNRLIATKVTGQKIRIEDEIIWDELGSWAKKAM